MRHVFLECKLDESCRTLERAGRPVATEPKVFDLIVYLIRHRDRVVLKEEMLKHLWPDQIVSDAALSQCVLRARRALGDTDPSQRVIHTVHSRGFRFVAPIGNHGSGAREPNTPLCDGTGSDQANA